MYISHAPHVYVLKLQQWRVYWRAVKLASSGRMRLPAYTSPVPPNSWKMISVTTPKTVPAPRRPASSSGFTLLEISICTQAYSQHLIIITIIIIIIIIIVVVVVVIIIITVVVVIIIIIVVVVTIIIAIVIVIVIVMLTVVTITIAIITTMYFYLFPLLLLSCLGILPCLLLLLLS